MRSIRDKDFKSLSTFIHPKQGVRFSPYAYVDTTYDIRLTAYAFLQKQTSKESLKWGFYDGSGDPISLTVDKYFSKFVNNTDFLKAEKVSLNKINRTGSTTNNLLQVYRNCQFAEYYFSGLDKKNEGIDWCALRLVFGKYNNQYYLIGIIHDQWTI